MTRIKNQMDDIYLHEDPHVETAWGGTQRCILSPKNADHTYFQTPSLQISGDDPCCNTTAVWPIVVIKTLPGGSKG